MKQQSPTANAPMLSTKNERLPKRKIIISAMGNAVILRISVNQKYRETKLKTGHFALLVACGREQIKHTKCRKVFSVDW